SNYPGAAAALDSAGVIHTGVNVENASYGLTLCAECSLISSWRLNAGAELSHLVWLHAAREYITPWGRCSPLRSAHAPTAVSTATQRGPLTRGELLPVAFGLENL